MQGITSNPLIPAQAGIQSHDVWTKVWIPASAGMSGCFERYGFRTSEAGRKCSPIKRGIFAFVIASQCNVGDFADVALSEAIQFCLTKDWIASSQEILAMTNSITWFD